MEEQHCEISHSLIGCGIGVGKWYYSKSNMNLNQLISRKEENLTTLDYLVSKQT